MSVILGRRSLHPRCCQCGHGENCHPLRLGSACRRPSCLCMQFEPERRSTSPATDLHRRAKARRNLTLDGLAK